MFFVVFCMRVCTGILLNIMLLILLFLKKIRKLEVEQVTSKYLIHYRYLKNQYIFFRLAQHITIRDLTRSGCHNISCK